MGNFAYKTRGVSDPQGKPRVYFCCHPEDFEGAFDKICDDIFLTHDCTIYYTPDMHARIPEQDLALELGSMNLFVIPVSRKLLSTPCRAMEVDYPYARTEHIPVLPIMLENGLDELYARPDKFGECQYLNPNSDDSTEVAYKDKLKRYLESVLISDEMARRVRAAFDAYIFLSYRKKDRRYANALMRLIHSDPDCRDIAVWFDEFLTPGESFKTNIEKILKDSVLFTLLVTPSLLEEPGGKPNFVMEQEYPAARDTGKTILPAQMLATDATELSRKFAGIPQCLNMDVDESRARLLAAISRYAHKENKDTPIHNFMIGLAYLYGIDVEIDRERAFALITGAADASLPQAMEKLIAMYMDGDGVSPDAAAAHSWSQRLADHYYEESFDCRGRIEKPERISELFSHYKDPYWSKVIRCFLLNADERLDTAEMEALFGLLLSYGLCEYTLLFDACQAMHRYQQQTQLLLVRDILQKAADGTYPAYGPLFWYVPEYGLYETVLLALCGLQQTLSFPKALALVRDVCFIFGQKDTAAEISDQVDSAALFRLAEPSLSGARAALCELFYTGATESEAGGTVYPKCFNIREAKAFLEKGCGASFYAECPFADSLGLFSHNAYPELDGEYIGIISCPYDKEEMEDRLKQKPCDKVRGLILAPTQNTVLEHVAFNRSSVRVMYIPENLTQIRPDATLHMPLEMGISFYAYFRDYLSISGISEIWNYMLLNANTLKRVDIAPGITGIGKGAFRNCTALEEISIPESVTRIAEDAFLWCSSLRQICLPDGLTQIAFRTFGCCEKLQMIRVPGNVKQIGNEAFWRCKALKTVTVEDGVQILGDNVFQSCHNLQEIQLPDSVTELGKEAFSGCEQLTHVRLSKKLTKLNGRTFVLCKNLQRISIPDSVTEMMGCEFMQCEALTEVRLSAGLMEIPHTAFSMCKSLKSICIPEGVTSIHRNAFEQCTALEQVELPRTLTTLWDGAFKKCESLRTVRIPDSVVEMSPRNSEGVFAGCYALTQAHISEGMTWISPLLFNGCGRLREVNIPKATTLIGYAAFYGCQSLQQIHIPDGVITIAKEAFCWCTGLTRLRLPDGIREIGERAFANCTGLAQIKIPDTVQSLGKDVFQGCTGLQKVSLPYWLADAQLGLEGEVEVLLTGYESGKCLRIPEGTVRIEQEAFRHNTTITQVILPEGLRVLERGAFANCVNLTEVQLPSTLEQIGVGAFYSCTKLERITLPDGLRLIDNQAFSCSALTQIEIPDSVTRVGKSAFEACRQLRQIRLSQNMDTLSEAMLRGCSALEMPDIPKGIRVIQKAALADCKSLTSIALPENVEKIESECYNGVFYGCSSLHTVSLPQKLRQIPPYLFSWCKSLKTVELPETVTAIGDGAFEYCTALETVVLPSRLVSIGKSAFRGCSGLRELLLPDTLSVIESGAFEKCDALERVRIPDEVMDLGFAVFDGCGSLREVVLPVGLTQIPQSLFAGCISLKQVDIPNTVTKIGSFAFSHCESLADVELPDSVEYMEGFAFSHCVRLKTVRFSQKLQTVPAKAFEACKSLRELEFTPGIQSLTANAFEGCTALTQIVIPPTVLRIGRNTFLGCSGLRSVSISKNFEKEIGSIFGDVDPRIVHFE